MQENVSAIRVVKAYVREDYESEKFKKASGNVQELLLRAEKVLSFNSPLMMATVYTCILLISWLGARMIVLSGATSFTTGELMSMLTYCTNILTSLMMLSMVFIMISMSAASAKRVAEVLEEESTLSNGENPVMKVKNGAVRFDHVCFRYKADGRDVLSDINLNIRSGETIGIIGGGQLGRMMALSARYMGFRVGVLDPTPNCPTGQVADFQITAEYDDRTAIHDLAVQSDVLTYEFENVDADAIDEVRGITATPQGTDLLRVTQHRVHEKRFINDHGTATAPWRAVNNFDELDAALDDIHYPAVLKTVSGGYDGHGQLVLRSDADLEKIRSRSDRGGGFPPSILEGFVDFAFEASILVSGNGKDFVTFPIVRNEHRNNILHMTIAPAEVSEHVAREAHELAIRLAKGFELAGTLAIELFITKDDQVIVNELAPRPHNSGHYTIEACSMDQFDAHIRGIAGWPLPKPKLLSPAVMVNVLGQHVEPTRALIATHPEWNVHDYGKAEVRHDRKMGHITVLTGDPAKTVADLEATGCWDDLKKKA